MIMALTIALLMAGGVYMVLQRGMVRIVVGMGLISHAVNLIILATGIGAWRAEPFAERTSITDAADPLPQAFVLTAIVITMATTAFMLALAALGRSDDTRSAEDPEERSPIEPANSHPAAAAVATKPATIAELAEATQPVAATQSTTVAVIPQPVSNTATTEVEEVPSPVETSNAHDTASSVPESTTTDATIPKEEATETEKTSDSPEVHDGKPVDAEETKPGEKETG